MVALQIASEPLVRQTIRQVYQTRAMVNVSPTKKGKKVYYYKTANCYMYIYMSHCFRLTITMMHM